MKSKLRTIVVKNQEFKYVVNESYQSSTNSKLGYWLTTLRVFKSGHKNTPLEIFFESQDDYALGNLITTSINELNLHKPSVIKRIVEEGLNSSWNWEESKFEIKEGLDFLEQLGYSIYDVRLNKK